MPTLTVSSTTSYVGGLPGGLTGVDLIQFTNSSISATATFANTQLDGSPILLNVAIAGSSAGNVIAVTGGSVNASGWTFSNWGSSGDQIRLSAAAGVAAAIIGSSENDTITGGSLADSLSGGQGNDRFVVTAADSGDDTIRGGAGVDTIDYSALAADFRISILLREPGIQGSLDIQDSANTIIATHRVFDVENVVGGAGGDLLIGNSLDNLLSGAGGADTLVGGAGADTLNGGEGEDVLRYASTGAGVDRLFGGNGADRFEITGAVGSSQVTMEGGAGTDTLSFQTDGGPALLVTSVRLDGANDSFVVLGGGTTVTISEIENVEGSDGANVISGDSLANWLQGFGGDDFISGQAILPRAGINGTGLFQRGTGQNNGSIATALDVTGSLVNGGLVATADETFGARAGFANVSISAGVDNLSIVHHYRIALNAGDQLIADVDSAPVFNSLTDGALFLYDPNGVLVSFATASQTVNIADAQNTDELPFLTHQAALGGFYTVAVGRRDPTITSLADMLDPVGANDYALRLSVHTPVNAAGVGRDTLEGGEGSDALVGSVGNDIVGRIFGSAEPGNDILIGNSGDDILVAKTGRELIDGGLGFDAVDVVNDLSLSATQLSGIEQVNIGFGTLKLDALAFALPGMLPANLTLNRGSFPGLGGVEILATPYAMNFDASAFQFGISWATSNTSQVKINGTAFADLIRGTTSVDIINGGDGADTLNGWGSLDNVFGEGGDDLLYGGDGNDVVDGGAGNDILLGDAGRDRIDGQADNDLLYGWLGDDTMTGGDGADTIFGEQNNDRLDGGGGADTLDGGDGFDTADFNASAARVIVNLFTGEGFEGEAAGDRYVSLEAVLATAFDDIVVGTAVGNFIDGRAGADTLYGNAGDDTLLGGEGADTLFGEADNDLAFGWLGNDLFWGGDGNDTLWGEQDNDTLLGETGDDMLLGVDGADVLYGWVGNDTLFGFTGDDVLWGEDGADSLLGEDGADTLIGGLGRDTMTGGAGADRFFNASFEIAAGEVDLITDYDAADRYLFQAGAQIQYFNFSAPGYGAGAGIHVQVAGGVYILDVLGATAAQLQAQTQFF
jgi:Ca2+-binding RTX toxin-like protein